jgi:hypothetical protein
LIAIHDISTFTSVSCPGIVRHWPHMNGYGSHTSVQAPAEEVNPTLGADSTSGGNATRATREVYWTRNSLLLLVLIVVSGSALAGSTQLNSGAPKNLVLALGTGTMVAAIVGFGQTLITATAAQRAMVTPLIEENRRALSELSAEYRSLNQEFFPTHVFDATDDPDPAFNHLLMQDLHDTRQYFFRGFSGRHAAARMLLSVGETELRARPSGPPSADGPATRSGTPARTSTPRRCAPSCTRRSASGWSACTWPAATAAAWTSR